VTQLELEHGIPLFLGQLVEALRCEEEAAPSPQLHRHIGFPKPTLVSIESGRTAALHGKELLDEGFTLDQVVHGYGDVCQAITELAQELRAPITVAEFHTFNRLLDNAIAEAVASYGRHQAESVSAEGAQGLHEQMGTLADEQRRLVDTALKALDALKVGNIGLMGATGSVLEDSLMQLRSLIDKSLPEIRLATGMTKPAKP
jgi:hypothetical protein